MAERKARIRNVKDSTANWEKTNPILLDGEIGIEVQDDGSIAVKIGDGETAWKLLDYVTKTIAEADAELAALLSQVETGDAALQAQIDNIVIETSGEGGDVTAEVAQARVDADGTNHETLKARLDAEQSKVTELKETLDDGIKSIATDLHYPLKVRVADIENLYDTVEVGAYYKPTEGEKFEDLTLINSSKLRTVVIDVSMGGIISFPVVNGLECPVFFLDANNKVISVYAQTEISSGTIVELSIPDGAVDFAFVFNTEWELSMKGFVTIKPTELTKETLNDVVKSFTADLHYPLKIKVSDIPSVYDDVRTGAYAIPKLGEILDNLTITNNSSTNKLRTVLIDVSMGGIVSFPAMNGTTFPVFFLDANNKVVSTYAQEELPSGTIVEVSIPVGAVKLAFVYNTKQDNSMDSFLTVKPYANKNKDSIIGLVMQKSLYTKYDYFDLSELFNYPKYGEGKLLEIGKCMGMTFADAINAYTGDVRNDIYYLKIDVSGYQHIYCPSIMSTTGKDGIFVDKNETIIGSMPNTSENRAIWCAVPIGAKYFYWAINATWEEDIFFVGIYSSLFIGSGSQGTAYPRLSDSEKEQILTLCDDYYNNRDRFSYRGATRDSYAGQSCFKTVNGEKYFDLVCSTFAQFIWMGRDIADFNIDNYTPDITKEFNWGYYFEFLLAQRTYGVKKPDGTRYGMSADGLYSYNSYGTSETSQSNMHLLTASDMAQELYTFGCEIPRSQLDVGDLVFYRHPTYDDMGLQCQLQFRNISHVAVVIDTNYQNSGYMLTIECLSGEDPCIVKQSVIMEDNQRALRAAFYEKRIVMCARHPHAFGKGGNVPSKITATRGKLV